MSSQSKINLRGVSDRGGFTIIFNELWTHYLPQIGGEGALLYCFLKSRVGQEIPSPCSREWNEEVCQPLGLTVLQSHQAWAKLQEMGLICYDGEQYLLREPQALSRQQEEVEAEDSLFLTVEELFGRPLSGTEIFQLENLAEDYAEQLITTAARFAVQSQVFSMPYIKQILLNWKAKGISTVAQAEEDNQQFSLRKARRNARRGESQPKRTSKPADNSNVNYDDEELILKRMLKAAKGEIVNHGW